MALAATIGATLMVAVPSGAAAARSRPAASVTPPTIYFPACATGRWQFNGTDGKAHDSRGYTVEAWDIDSTSADDLLGTTTTGTDGTWRICFANSDLDGEQGQDVYVDFVSRNERWRVEWNGRDYRETTRNTKVFTNVATFSTVDFGVMKPSRPEDHGALKVFDAAYDVWSWLQEPCWDPLDAPELCRQIRISWASDSMERPRYAYTDDRVILNAEAADVPSAIAHEMGHAVMDDLYEDAIPDDFGGMHFINTESNPGLAWAEGFAEWFQASVYGNPVVTFTTGEKTDLEEPTWGTPNWDNGDRVEGRVAGALIDLIDNVNEAPWDRYGEGRLGTKGSVWSTVVFNRLVSFREFWDAWEPQAGTGESGALAALYQNTVDYTFRDPLTSGQTLTRPTPRFIEGDNYETSGAHIRDDRWAAVATRPTTADPVGNTLSLYGDRALTELLATSGRGPVPFVAFTRPDGEVYPKVVGGGPYAIQYSTSSAVVEPDTEHMSPMCQADLVHVYEAYVSGGNLISLSVAPTGNLDVEVFLLGPRLSGDGTLAVPRGGETAAASAAGPGGEERIAVTVVEEGWYAVLVTNKGGDCNAYTLKRGT